MNLTAGKLTIVRHGQRAGLWAILVCVLACCIPALAQSRTDAFIVTIDRVKRSVVPILCGTFDDKGQFSVQMIDGTGFFVNDAGYVVTAAHVIKDLQVTTPQRPKPCAMAIYVPLDGWQRNALAINTRWYTVTCEVNDPLDLAVCHPVGAVTTKIEPLILDETQPSDGSPVAFTGFPLGLVEPLSARGDIASYRGVDDTDGPKELIIDRGTWPGASGSPVYSPDGVVLGIVLQRGLNEATGIAIARPSHFIIKFLREKKVDVPSATAKNDKRKK